MSSPIQKFIEDYKNLNNFLISNGQISSSVDINEHYRKILLLSCASYYETQIIDILKAFVKLNSNDDRIFSFMNNKAIQRQYYTYFDWDQTNNINKFLGMFGEEFKTTISNEIKSNNDLALQVKAFLEIGSERNKMVHRNFLEYKLDKTFDEITELHNKAQLFIEYIRQKLCD